MADLLTICREVTSSGAQFEWITDEPWLVAHGVKQWMELPLRRTHAEAWAVDSSRAHTAGLNARSLRSTTADTWAWIHSGQAPIIHGRPSVRGTSHSAFSPGLVNHLWKTQLTRHATVKTVRILTTSILPEENSDMTESLIVMYTLAGTFILIGIVGGSGMQLGNRRMTAPLVASNVDPCCRMVASPPVEGVRDRIAHGRRIVGVDW
jgi:hypothetical protein